jgi:hypothetical protein
MDTTKLVAIVGLLVALSAASERLVEIIKGLSGWLNDEKADPVKERQRKAALQFLAVLAGIGTTLLARPSIPAELLPKGMLSFVALGLLASGGSGLWNSVLTYLLEIKNIKENMAAVSAKKAEMAKTITAEAATNDNIDTMAAADALAKLSLEAK